LAGEWSSSALADLVMPTAGWEEDSNNLPISSNDADDLFYATKGNPSKFVQASFLGK
jgi:hypothetical protein